jgi:hypothetical protein
LKPRTDAYSVFNSLVMDGLPSAEKLKTPGDSD